MSLISRFKSYLTGQMEGEKKLRVVSTPKQNVEEAKKAVMDVFEGDAGVHGYDENKLPPKEIDRMAEDFAKELEEEKE